MSEKIANTFEKAKNYNTWEGRPFQTGYERNQYLEKIIKFLDTKLVKVGRPAPCREELSFKADYELSDYS